MAGVYPRHKARRAQGGFVPLLPKSVQVLKSGRLLCFVGLEQKPTKHTNETTPERRATTAGRTAQTNRPNRTPGREETDTQTQRPDTPETGRKRGRANRTKQTRERTRATTPTRDNPSKTADHKSRTHKTNQGRTRANPHAEPQQASDTTGRKNRQPNQRDHHAPRTPRKREPKRTNDNNTGNTPKQKIYAVWHYLQCTHCFLGTVVSFKQGRERSVYKPRLVRGIRHTPSVASLSAKKDCVLFFAWGCRPVVWHNWRANGVNSFCQMIVSVPYRFCQMIVSVLSRF